MPVSKQRKNHKQKVKNRNQRLKEQYNRFMNFQREAMEKMINSMKNKEVEEKLEE